jgi:hypothetical protein
MQRRIFIGWDPREVDAYAVARHSVLGHMTREIPVHGLFLGDLQARGLYRRPTEQRLVGGRASMWDVLSDAPMSTEHANARFMLPHLAWDGWALFMDGDMLAMDDIAPLFDALDPKYAVYCVKHRHEPPQGTKMDGQMQLRYARKNWTSFMVFNCDHPANLALTVDMVNSLPGRDLHRSAGSTTIRSANSARSGTIWSAIPAPTWFHLRRWSTSPTAYRRWPVTKTANMPRRGARNFGSGRPKWGSATS